MDLDEFIQLVKEQQGVDLSGVLTTADKIKPPPENPYKAFEDRNPLAGGGMLAQPSADGSRQEYGTSTVKTKKFKYPITNQHGTFYSDKKPKSSAREIGSGKFSMAERNRVTRIKYPEYNSYSELLKKEPKKARVVMSNLQYASIAGTKIKKKTRFTPLTTIQQNKILAEFPSADFSKGKLGFNSETDKTKYQQVKTFIERGYKPRFKKIPEKLQEDIKQKFSYFKDWDFDKFKYGVPNSGGGGKNSKRNRENNILAQRVKTFISDPKPFKLAFSMDRPGSWMLQQMYRAWEHGNTDYVPIYNKNDKVIGMKENGKAYYANKNVAPSNKTKLINSHPEFNKVQKFVDVANEAKLPLKDLGGYKNTKSLLALFPEGYESIKFTDLVSYLYKQQGVDATRNAIEKHHLKSLSDMGAPVDSKNLQLLRKDLNTLGNTITQQIKKGDLSRVSDLEKAGVKITVDGKTYGKGFQDPRRQLNRIIGDATQKVSGLNKTQLNNLLKQLKAGNVKGVENTLKQTGLKNAGFISRELLESAAKGIANVGRVLTKYGILPEAGFLGADYLIRTQLGDSPKEAFLRTTDFARPGDQTKEAEILETSRFFGDKAGQLVGRVIDYEKQLAKIESLKQQKQSLENLTPTSDFSYLPDTSQGIKNIDDLIKQATLDLNNKFNMTEAERTYANRIREETDDARMATSNVAKTKLERSQSPNYRTAAPQAMRDMRSQMDLNLDMLPTMPRNFMESKFSDILDYTQNLKAAGYDVSSKDILEERDRLKNLSMEDLAQTYSPEQIYGAQGTFFGQPLAGGGIAKIAGVDQGPPPESGPNSQGLKGILKRAMKIKE